MYLALDRETHTRVILKTPSINYDDDAECIDRFLRESWAGRRIKNQHVLQVLKPHAQRQCLYYVTEHIEGQTLRQWMNDNRQPAPDSVRKIVQQIPAVQFNPDVPAWLDRALEKATAIARNRRYTRLSEFIHDLEHPNPAFVSRGAEPLIERNPLLVWKGIAMLLFILNLLFLYLLAQ